MTYLLERRPRVTGEVFELLGIVIADSIEKAAEKVGGVITYVIRTPVAAVEYAILDGGYGLQEMAEFVGTLADLVPTTT